MKATDSTGHVDMRHVVLGVQVEYQGYAPTQIAKNTYAAVEENSGVNRISVMGIGSELMSYCSGMLYIDAQPAHGTLQLDPDYLGCVLYAPDQDYRGLDTFAYHWRYKKLDYWHPYTLPPLGWAETNVSRQQIQVGNWVDLEPDEQLGVYSTVLAVGGKTTATLTLQNPRADGVSTPGFWELSFNPDLIRVYDSSGKEILPPPSMSIGWPSDTFLETVADEEQITLTVVGVSAGQAELTATWNAWGGEHDSTLYPDVALFDGWHWITTESIDFAVVDVDLDIDSDNANGLERSDYEDQIEEELPGKLVRLNNDDDNGNGVPDLEEAYGATVAGEDDLAEVRLHALVDAALGEISDWSVTLQADLDDLAMIRVYDNPEKGIPYLFQTPPGGDTGSISFNLDAYGTFAETLWVEGIETDAVTLDLILANDVLGIERRDTIKLTVLELQEVIVYDLSNIATAEDQTPKDLHIVQDELTATVTLVAFFDPQTFGEHGTGQFVHATIVRSDGQSVLDTTCRDDHVFLNQSLVALETARDFTVTVWVDMNRNGAVDSNEDRRTVIVHIVKVKLHMVNYGATESGKFHSIRRDPTPTDPGSSYGTCQWTDDNLDGDAADPGDNQFPISYSCTSPTNGEVKIKTEVWIKVLGDLGTNFEVRATGTIDGQTIHMTQTTPGPFYNSATGEIWATLESDEAIPNYICDDTLTLDWQVMPIDADLYWQDVGTSENRAYLTWKAPLDTAPFETCLYVGCSAAEGMYGHVTSNDVVTTLYAESFAGCSVHRIDGTLMVYNHDVDTSITAAQMLAHPTGKGQCTAWADLLVQVLAAQGIEAERYDISAITPYTRFRVKLMPAQGSGGANYIPGTEGIGFGFHQVVRVNGFADTIFDPSYGTHTEKTDDRSVELKYEDEIITQLGYPPDPLYPYILIWVLDPKGVSNVTFTLSIP